MTDIEPCLRPQGHQRHRWFDGDQEIKCPGVAVAKSDRNETSRETLPHHVDKDSDEA